MSAFKHRYGPGVVTKYGRPSYSPKSLTRTTEALEAAKQELLKRGVSEEAIKEIDKKIRQQVAEAQALRDAHFMHCPKCGHALQTIQLREVAVDRCFHCHGTWLDEGELEKLAAPEASHSLLQSVVDIFRSRG
jgi:hypothetical protein